MYTELRWGEVQTAKRGAAERQGPGGDFGKSSDGRAVRRGSSPDRHQARKGNGEPKGLRRAQERAQRRGPWGKAGLESRGRSGTGRARASRGSDGWSLEPRQSPLRSVLFARGSGAKGDGDSAGWGNMKSPVPQCWSFVPGGRHPPNPPAMGERAPPSSSAPLHRERKGTGIVPCPVPGVPGRDTAPPGAGRAGQAERDRPAPAAPGAAPAPRPGPGAHRPRSS